MGGLRDRPLPIYGSKVLAVRNGFLSLWGKPLNTTWTQLGKTANIDDDEILLLSFVDWTAGSKIVISSTTTNPFEAEEATILSITQSNDGTLVKLTEPLIYQHSGISDKINGKTLEYRAEVGLLTRNIVIEGAVNEYASALTDSYLDQFGGQKTKVVIDWPTSQRLDVYVGERKGKFI